MKSTAEIAVMKAGKKLLSVQNDHPLKMTRDAIESAFDLSEKEMIKTIKDTHPTHLILGEPKRGIKEIVSPIIWSINPIEGFKEFSLSLPHFATSAVAVKDDIPIACAVYIPYTKEMFSAERSPEDSLNAVHIEDEDEDDDLVKEKQIERHIIHEIKKEQAVHQKDAMKDEEHQTKSTEKRKTEQTPDVVNSQKRKASINGKATVNGETLEISTSSIENSTIGLITCNLKKFTHQEQRVKRALKELGAEVLEFSSATIALSYCAAGRLDAVVVTNGNPWEWIDGVLLVEMAGGVVLGQYGEEFTLNSHGLIAGPQELVNTIYGGIEHVKNNRN